MSRAALLPTDKIQARHRERQAIVYVRQSTVRQVLQHQESTRLQYALSDRGRQLGWGQDQVVVIDDDLGRSAASTLHRPGFQRLVAEVGLGHVGLVLGIEVSRLARSCRDWHQLLEMCALFDTLIADADGVYDAANFNDRLPQASPHISDCPKYFREQRLSLQHGGEGFHQRKQTAFRHGWDQVVEHATLAEQ
jgi:hypothetical protein